MSSNRLRIGPDSVSEHSVTFRMTRLDTPGGSLVKVDGWLQADGIAELERVCGEPSAGLTLDLGDLRQADASALGALRRAAARGARLVNCSPYLTLLLGEPADPAGHDEHQNRIL